MSNHRPRGPFAVVTVLAVLPLLVGCSSAAGIPAPTVTEVVTTTVTPPAPSQAAATAPRDATAAAKALQDEVQQVRKVLTITEDNDPNDLLGRPTGYASAAVLYDSRTTCSDGPGADCGATVEQWSNHADATARAERIQSILKGAPALGTEYDTVRGSFVLRVAGKLKPSAAKSYRKAFEAQF